MAPAVHSCRQSLGKRFYVKVREEKEAQGGQPHLVDSQVVKTDYQRHRLSPSSNVCSDLGLGTHCMAT